MCQPLPSPISPQSERPGERGSSHVSFTVSKVRLETNPRLPDVMSLLAEEGKVSGLKLFRATKGGATEVAPRLAEVEADVQRLIELNMETLLGVRFLASE